MCLRMAPLRMLYIMTLTYIVKVKLFKWLFGQVNVGKLQTLLLKLDRKSGICHRMAPRQMLYIMTPTYILKVTNL